VPYAYLFSCPPPDLRDPDNLVGLV
jgi:hypothetical protein